VLPVADADEATVAGVIALALAAEGDGEATEALSVVEGTVGEGEGEGWGLSGPEGVDTGPGLQRVSSPASTGTWDPVM
jgi:hypothetical protein